MKAGDATTDDAGGRGGRENILKEWGFLRTGGGGGCGGGDDE